MVIGIDIDDTLNYFVKPNIEVAVKYIEKNGLNCKLVNKKTNYFSQIFDWSEDVCNKFFVDELKNMLNTALVRENASNVIKRLKEDGHKIIIITARSEEYYDNPYEISCEWLNKNNILFDELLVGYYSKANICIEKNIDLFIDDNPQILREIKSKGINTLLMKNFYNDFVTDLPLVSCWNDVEDYIKNNF